MESNTPTTSNAGLPADNTAETLRALQERAQAALAAQRARMGQLETQLTAQLDSISAAISDELASHSGNELQVNQAFTEIASVRQELAEVRAAWAREKELTAADATSGEQLLEKQRAELEPRTEELTNSRRDLESRQLALDDRATQLNGRERELRRTHDELEGRAQESARQQARLATAEAQLEQSRAERASRESELQSTEQSLAAREAALRSSEQQVVLNQANLNQREDSWQTDRAAIENERDRLRDQLTQLSENNLSHGSELATQLTEVRRELAAQQIAAENEHTRAENERISLHKELAAAVEARDELAAQFAILTDQSQIASTQLANQLADVRQQLESRQSAWDFERAELEAQRLALCHERDELSSALTATSQQLEDSRAQSDTSAERDALQQKLELVLADLQRLRGRTAELEQELASRPETDQKESIDLVRLRGERDALAHRVAELEQQPAAIVDSDAAQQIADLQRRFELAVEDVRDLKKQNTQLEAKLQTQVAAAKSVPPTATGPVAGNWEAVKKQLLASLEGEATNAEPVRQKEISTIENTIHITDEIVANKDRQIAELKLKLTSGLGAEDGDSSAAEGLEAALDADAIIQKHRTRIAEIEREMEAKLRETEMQLSLERAKIAREQSQLTQLRIELDAMRGPNAPKADTGGGNAPKRRWLSKLGLGEEEKEKK